jgi:hypothetical protein
LFIRPDSDSQEIGTVAVGACARKADLTGGVARAHREMIGGKKLAAPWRLE